MSFGLTPQGFKRKTYNDLITDMEARAKSLFGNDVNLTVRSPLGIIIRIIAWFLSLLWQDAENIYNSAFVDTAEGVQLDYVGKYIGITRIQAKKASGQITINGTDGTVIPEGFMVETESGIQFKTIQEVTISGGSATAAIEAIEAGTRGNVVANSITVIVNPTVGVDSVTNNAETTGGQDRESDQAFRERYALSVAKGGASTIDSIHASLLQIPNVRAAIVVENNTMETDPDGRPPKSIECYVLGGDSADIAKEILVTKAAGIQAYGTETVIVNDLAGNPHTIKFTYAAQKSIYVNINITKNAKYPTDGDKQVKTAIIKYIGGNDEDGSVYAGLSMGEDVVYTKLISTVYSISGIDDVSVKVSTNGVDFSQGNIAVEQAEVAETDFNKVVVTSA